MRSEQRENEGQETERPENVERHNALREIIEFPGIPEEEDIGFFAKTGTVSNPILPEKEPAVQTPRTVPDGIPEACQIGPGVTGSRTEPGKKRATRKKPPVTSPVTEVYRKTDMQGMSPKSFPMDPAQIRRQTERDLKNPEFGIPYTATEKAVRDLVCSLVERQDRVYAGILLDINCMEQDIGMLKDQVYKLKMMKSGPAQGEKT